MLGHVLLLIHDDDGVLDGPTTYVGELLQLQDTTFAVFLSVDQFTSLLATKYMVQVIYYA